MVIQLEGSEIVSSWTLNIYSVFEVLRKSFTWTLQQKLEISINYKNILIKRIFYG